MKFRNYFGKRSIGIIGCGRSGTGFIVERLNEVGLDVGYETLKSDGMASWMSTVHSFSELKDTYKVLVHQVRNPLDCISSLQTFQHNSWIYIENYVKEMDREDSLLLKAMKYWYHWNLIAETKTSLRIQIEEFEKFWPFLCHMIGVRMIKTHISDQSKVNSREDSYTKIVWGDLDRESEIYSEKCRTLAMRYGYMLNH